MAVVAMIAASPHWTPHPARINLRLTITATDFKNTTGQAIIALYASKETWLKSERALRLQIIPIVGSSVTVTFDSLSPGTYAASAIHDENKNGKLDMRYFPIPGPREGAGVSNNARKALGPPSWDDAKFMLQDTATVITFSIRY
ncbi:MAG: DUF2141 domain-containing protein [Gemmatimonadales bacterium]